MSPASAAAPRTSAPLVLLGLLLAACRTPDPQAEIALSDLETYWAVDRPAGNTQYIAPVARFRLHNKGHKAHYSIQATATFRRDGETQIWSSAWRQAAPINGRPLAVGESAEVVLKPEGEGRYTSIGAPESMFQNPQFKDVRVTVFVKVGSSPWSPFTEAAVERRIGTRSVPAPP